MTLRDHDRLQTILTAFQQDRAQAQSTLLSQKRRSAFVTGVVFRPMEDNEVVKAGDFVEDIDSGDAVRVCRNTHYDFAEGMTVAKLKELPRVFGVVRPE